MTLLLKIITTTYLSSPQDNTLLMTFLSKDNHNKDKPHCCENDTVNSINIKGNKILVFDE